MTALGPMRTAALVSALLVAGCATAEARDQLPGPANEVGTGPTMPMLNTTRLAGGDPLGDAIAITQTVYPATIEGENVPDAVILAPLDDLALQLTAVQITHHPINAPVLFADQTGIPDQVRTELRRMGPEGVAMDANTQIYVVGDLNRAAEQARNMGYRVRHFPGVDPAAVARDIDAWKSTLEGDHEPHTVIADLNHPELLLPVASFYAHAPVSLAWTRGTDIPPATQTMLSRRGGDAFLYLVGDPTVIPQPTATALRTYGHVQRLNAADPVAMSQTNASFGDVSREFSWDIDEPGHNFTIVPETAPPAAVTATLLSHLGKHGPMLVVPPDRVPEEIRTYLEGVQPTYTAPNEALFNHGWIVGGTDDITDTVQAQIDTLLAQQRDPPVPPPADVP